MLPDIIFNENDIYFFDQKQIKGNYITNKEIYVFEEKLATELVLRAGDLDILIVSRK